MTVIFPSVQRVELSPAAGTGQLRELAIQAGEELDGHGKRVASMVPLILLAAGAYSERWILLKFGALLHDIGKRHISCEILNAPRRLTQTEWVLMQQHPVFGLDILRKSVRDLPHDVADCVLLHHERWDGKGYPTGLAGEAIPLFARIVAIADFIDALASPRCYKPAVPIPIVRKLIDRESGLMFDPVLAEVTLLIWERLIHARWRADRRPAFTTR
ncbi:HD domain-containing phosphohydrolase [Acetobacter sp. LMG 32666]|uniref:HD-GYP domain-containing protein n=1 Tax=Acetobacter sp. LMG 32666 TaxID=2959295 RepID=UPI0030C7D92C